MNVLFLLYRYPGVGGIENMTTLLAQLFNTQLGYCTSIFSLVGQEGIEVDSALQDLQIDVKIAHCSDNQQIATVFLTFLEENVPDVIIFQDSYAQIEYLLNIVKNISTFKETKILTVEHNTPDCLIKGYIDHWKKHKLNTIGGLLRKIAFPYFYKKTLKENRIRHQKLVELSDKYILLSDSYKKILKNLFRIESDKVVAIANIKNDFSNSGVYSNYEVKKKQFLFVGRLNAQKGVDKLIDVWSILEKRIPDYELLVIGDGEQRSLLENLIIKNNLKRIRLEGFQTNMATYYKEATGILMTSIFEGLPLVLAEAMQYGVIPFAFDSFTSLHDVVEDKKNGFIIPPFSTSDYVTSVCDFVHLDQDKVKLLRLNAIKDSEKFSKERILSDWENLFNSLR